MLIFQAGLLDAVEDRLELTLLHTSDIHGQVLPFDDARNRPASGSLAQVASLVKRVRASLDHPLLVLDSGDAIQGTPLEQFAHIHWQRRSPSIEAMNRIGYEAMAVGNHEFNFGLDALRRAEGQASFPLLSANTVSATTGEPVFEPFVVLELESVRIGVLGLTTSNIPAWERSENIPGLRFEPMDEAAWRWVRRLRDEAGCDLVIVLAHTGFENDPDSGEPIAPANENFAWRLSRVVGIDVLLTGHEHVSVPPRRMGEMIVSQPAAHAAMVTRIDLELERSETGWRIAAWRGANLGVENETPDQELMDLFADLHAEVDQALDEPVAEVAGPISVGGCRLRDCAALELVHAVQLDTSGAQLSLAAILSDGTPDLAPGPVTWRWIHAFYVYPNTLQAVEVTGAQVKEILEHGALYYAGLECRPDEGCVLEPNPAIALYNVDSMAGVSYRIDPNRPAGDRIRDLRFEGRPVDLHETFTLASNSYRAAGGGGYPHLANAPVVWKSSEEMTDLIASFLSRVRNWQPRVDGNWCIGPDVEVSVPLSATRRVD